MEILDIIQSTGIIGILAFLIKYVEAERKDAVKNEDAAEDKFVNAVKDSTATQVQVIKESHAAEQAIMRELLEASKGVNNEVIAMLKEELEKCATDRREQRVAILQLANKAGEKVLPEQTEPSLKRNEAMV